MNIHLNSKVKENNTKLLLLLVPILVFFFVTALSFQVQQRQVASSGEVSVLGTSEELDTDLK